MPTLTYSAASQEGWLAVAGESVLLVLTARPERFDLDEAFSAVSGAGGFQLALDLLTRNGLSATPEFVLVEVGTASRARLVVRGAMTLGFEDASGEHELTGAQVSTWAELTVAGLVRVRLGSPGAEPVAAAGLLPLAAGAAWVSSLELRVAGQATAHATPASAHDTPPTVQEAPPMRATPSGAAPTPLPSPTGQAAPPVAITATDIPRGDASQASSAPTAQTRGAAFAAGRDPEVEESHAPAEVTVTELPSAPGGDDYDYLFGATMFRTVADAAVRSDDDTDDDPEAEGRAGGGDSRDDGGHGTRGEEAAPGDHDGHTVLGSDIRALRATRTEPRAETPPVAPAATPAPAIILELSTGAREPLGQPVLIGRAPSVSQVSGLRLPRLVTVGGADSDISRNHAQFALEGDSVVVTDLHSRNGTLIRLPGREPQKLRGGEPTTIIVGTLVDFGSGVTVTVGEL